MKLFVIDTSVAVKWIISKNEKYIEQSDRLLEHIKNNMVRCYAPHLLLYEIGNAMISKQCTTSYMRLAFRTIYNLPIEFVINDYKLAEKTMVVSKESDMTFYDALFIALAQQLKADLVTDNIKHQGKYSGKAVKVIPLKDYR